MNDEDELREQMNMLAGLGELDVSLDLGVAPSAQPATQATVASVQPVTETTANSVAATQPYTPENPSNLGVVTNIITPVQPVYQQAPAQPTYSAQPMQATTAPASVATSNFAAFDDDEPIFATLGQDTTDERLPFINLKPGEATKIMIFTLDMITVFTHFVDGLGYFRCKSKRDNGFITLKCPCCEFTTDDGKPIYAKERKILPVIEYPVAKDGKSLLAGKQPQLKFIVLSKRDMQSLSTILSPEVIQDKTKLAQVLGMDFSVKIEDGDTFKTKLIASTFDTIRNQYPDISKEVAKYNRDLLVQARDERFRDVPVESMRAALEKERADRLAAQQLAATPVPTASMLGI